MENNNNNNGIDDSRSTNVLTPKDIETIVSHTGANIKKEGLPFELPIDGIEEFEKDIFSMRIDKNLGKREMIEGATYSEEGTHKQYNGDKSDKSSKVEKVATSRLYSNPFFLSTCYKIKKRINKNARKLSDALRNYYVMKFKESKKGGNNLDEIWSNNAKNELKIEEDLITIRDFAITQAVYDELQSLNDLNIDDLKTLSGIDENLHLDGDEFKNNIIKQVMVDMYGSNIYNGNGREYFGDNISWYYSRDRNQNRQKRLVALGNALDKIKNNVARIKLFIDGNESVEDYSFDHIMGIVDSVRDEYGAKNNLQNIERNKQENHNEIVIKKRKKNMKEVQKEVEEQQERCIVGQLIDESMDKVFTNTADGIDEASRKLFTNDGNNSLKKPSYGNDDDDYNPYRNDRNDHRKQLESIAEVEEDVKEELVGVNGSRGVKNKTPTPGNNNIDINSDTKSKTPGNIDINVGGNRKNVNANVIVENKTPTPGNIDINVGGNRKNVNANVIVENKTPTPGNIDINVGGNRKDVDANVIVENKTPTLGNNIDINSDTMNSKIKGVVKNKDENVSKNGDVNITIIRGFDLTKLNNAFIMSFSKFPKSSFNKKEEEKKENKVNSNTKKGGKSRDEHKTKVIELEKIKNKKNNKNKSINSSLSNDINGNRKKVNNDVNNNSIKSSVNQEFMGNKDIGIETLNQRDKTNILGEQSKTVVKTVPSSKKKDDVKVKISDGGVIKNNNNEKNNVTNVINNDDKVGEVISNPTGVLQDIFSEMVKATLVQNSNEWAMYMLDFMKKNKIIADRLKIDDSNAGNNEKIIDFLKKKLVDGFKEKIEKFAKQEKENEKFAKQEKENGSFGSRSRFDETVSNFIRALAKNAHTIILDLGQNVGVFKIDIESSSEEGKISEIQVIDMTNNDIKIDARLLPKKIKEVQLDMLKSNIDGFRDAPAGANLFVEH